jgi:hypothetical protein
MQTATVQAQHQERTADIVDRQLPADKSTCACGEHQRLAWSCGEVLFVLVEEQMLVRFGRKAAPARPRVLVLLRSPTGRYFVVAEEGHVELAIEKLPDTSGRVRLVTRRDGQPVATATAIVNGDEGSLRCASNAGFLHFGWVRDLPLTPGP